MLQIIRYWLASLLLSQSVYAVDPFTVIDSFTITQQELYNHDQNFTAKYMMQPEIFVLADSMVATDAKKNVLDLLSYARYIFTSCADYPGMDAVYFKDLDVKVLSSVEGKRKITKNDAKKLVNKTRTNRNKVGLYFLRESHHDKWGYAYSADRTKQFPQNKLLQNTSFVLNRPTTWLEHAQNYPVVSSATMNRLDGEYPVGTMGVITAHELYHIYCKCSYHSSEEQNFMNSYPTGEGLIITKDQCQKMIDASAGSLIEVNN